MTGGIAVVTSGFPRRSETFALNELLSLDEAGVLCGIFATKPGDGARPHPGTDRLLRHVRVLPPGPPERQAARLADLLAARHVSGIHGYFAHLPAEVASLAARRLGVPWGFSVHARDARKVPPAALAERAGRAACVIACNADVCGDVRRAGGAAEVVPHGVDLRRFPPRPGQRDAPLRLLAVGRLVEKKGFHVLLEAVASVTAPVRLRVVGEGPERERLAGELARLGLAGRVELVGPLTHAELPDEYARAHAVVVPSIADSSGDRDGLPNVVLEAMASGLPVLASDTGAIAAAVDESTGIFVPPCDAYALADALARLAADPELRARLGRAGRARAEREFDLAACARRLVRRLEAVYA